MTSLLRRLANSPNVQVLVGLMWSFSAVLIKDLTTGGKLDIFLISSLRSLIGFAFLLPLVLVNWLPEDQPFAPPPQTVLPPKRWNEKAIMLLGSCSLAANTFLLCWAFEHTAALTPMFMHYSGLLLVAPASRIVLNYAPTRSEWVACSLAFVGITTLVFHGLNSMMPPSFAFRLAWDCRSWSARCASTGYPRTMKKCNKKREPGDPLVVNASSSRKYSPSWWGSALVLLHPHRSVI